MAVSASLRRPLFHCSGEVGKNFSATGATCVAGKEACFTASISKLKLFGFKALRCQSSNCTPEVFKSNARPKPTMGSCKSLAGFWPPAPNLSTVALSNELDDPSPTKIMETGPLVILQCDAFRV